VNEEVAESLTETVALAVAEGVICMVELTLADAE